MPRVSSSGAPTLGSETRWEADIPRPDAIGQWRQGPTVLTYQEPARALTSSYSRMIFGDAPKGRNRETGHQ